AIDVEVGGLAGGENHFAALVREPGQELEQPGARIAHVQRRTRRFLPMPGSDGISRARTSALALAFASRLAFAFALRLPFAFALTLAFAFAFGVTFSSVRVFLRPILSAPSQMAPSSI